MCQGAIFSGVGGGSESQQPEQQDYASQQYGGGQYQQQQQQQQGYAQQYEQVCVCAGAGVCLCLSCRRNFACVDILPSSASSDIPTQTETSGVFHRSFCCGLLIVTEYFPLELLSPSPPCPLPPFHSAFPPASTAQPYQSFSYIFLCC